MCPYGKAWWDEPSAANTAHGFAECSNKGLCDRNTGVCNCQSGFEGSACQRGACHLFVCHVQSTPLTPFATTAPVSCPTDTNGNYCSGQGTCHSMAEAQQHRTINGELSGVSEVQTLTCTKSSGTFALTYNYATTADIAYNAAASAVKSALEALPSYVMCGE